MQIGAAPLAAVVAIIVAAVAVVLYVAGGRPLFVRHQPLPPVTDPEPAIVPLLERLDVQTTQLGHTLHAVRRLWIALAFVLLGIAALSVGYFAQRDKTRDLAHRAVVLSQANKQFVVRLQGSRVGTLTQLCRDEKTLVSLVPPRYPPLAAAILSHPRSPLNPHVRCDDFAHAHIGPTPPPLKGNP